MDVIISWKLLSQESSHLSKAGRLTELATSLFGKYFVLVLHWTEL